MTEKHPPPSDLIELPDSNQEWRTIQLEGVARNGDQVHLMHRDEVHAINAALMAGRPLLVKGEPGSGKSQLARAAAVALQRGFVSHVVSSHTESQDLLWHVDAVKRLAEAQMAGVLEKDPLKARKAVALSRFLHPGPLWWAFNWEDAREQARLAASPLPGGQSQADSVARGCVLLIDEIDKAESEVPNGLLEALGWRSFTPPGRSVPVTAQGAHPLVIITTNGERDLPPAFIRRCLVLRLKLPELTRLPAWLEQRGAAHFPDAPQAVLDRAAELLVDNREKARAKQLRPLPGQAEYLDLLRAVLRLSDSESERLEMLEVVAPYVLEKNVDHADA